MTRHLAVALLVSTLSCACQPQSPPRTSAYPPAPPMQVQPAVTQPAPLPPAPQRTAVVVDSAGIRLEASPQILVPPGVDPSQGADPAYKRSGPHDLYLVPLAEALQREQTAGRMGGALRVVASPETGYRTLVEVLFTAGQTQVGEFEICEASCGLRSVRFSPPRPGSHAWDPAKPALRLAVIVVADGVSLKGAGGNVAPGCNGVGPGLTMPRASGRVDVAAVAACAAKLKASDPAFAAEEEFTIAANPAIPLREVMDLVLALRPSFPKVFFAVPR